MYYRKISKSKYLIELDKSIDGKRFRKSARVITDLRGKELEQYLKKEYQKLEKEALHDAEHELSQNISYIALAEHFIETNIVEDRTKVYYEYYLLGRPKDFFNHKNIQNIAKLDISRFFDKLKKTKTNKGAYLSAKTIKHYHTCLNALFNYAISFDIISTNPCSKIKLPQQTKSLDGKYYTVDEVREIADKLREAENIELLLAFSLAIVTSARPAEIEAITMDKIDFKAKTLTIDRAVERVKKKKASLKATKTEDTRICHLSDDLIELVHEHRSYTLCQSDFLFCNDKGDIIGENRLNERFKKFCDMNGLRYLSMYKWRHTSATILALKNIPIISIAKQLGHTNIATTMTYVHAVESVQDSINSILSDAVSEKNKTGFERDLKLKICK